MVSTICRGSRPGEPSGHLYVVDTERGVLGSCEVPAAPYLEREPNPRGGIRGGRGLAAAGDTLLVANGAQVLRFDRAWRPLTTISHPWCGNLHDIAVHDDRLWVCSTANDALAVFDLAGRLTDLVDLRPTALLDGAGDGARFAATIDYRDPAGYELAASNRLHANGIGFDASGVPLVSVGRTESEDGCERGLIVRADGRADPLAVADDVAVPTHNVAPLADGTVLTLDSAPESCSCCVPTGRWPVPCRSRRPPLTGSCAACARPVAARCWSASATGSWSWTWVPPEPPHRLHWRSHRASPCTRSPLCRRTSSLCHRASHPRERRADGT